MDNKFRLNYIKCPDCKNVLNMTFVTGYCPNPLCGFNFDGLEALLHKDDYSLHKAIIKTHKDNNRHEIKLLATAARANMTNYLSHYISCDWGAHYQNVFKDFLVPYLDDLNVVKSVLKSDTIQIDKNNVVISKNGYKMFWELYEHLMKVRDRDIRDFLRFEFPLFSRKYLKLLHDKLKKNNILPRNNQAKLV